MKRACLMLLMLCGCPTLPGIEDGGADAGRPVAGPVVDLAAGATHACGTTQDGGVWCWGSYVSGAVLETLTGDLRPVPIRGVSNPRQLALGVDLSCALLRDETVSCWGRGSEGQLGNGASSDSNTAVPVSGLSGVLELAAGDRHVCARMSDATVRCWGENGHGQLGNGSTMSSNLPVTVTNLTATQLDLGTAHGCAMRASGSPACWGDNAAGQLGDATMMEQDTPVPVFGPTPGSRVAVGGNRSCVLRDDLGVSCWGLGAALPAEVLSRDAGFTEPLPDGGLPELAAGGAQVCVRSGDTVHCLDAGTFDIPGAVQLAGGGGFMCARTAAGAVSCWGKNDVGQLGDGTQGPDKSAPTPVKF